MIGKRTLAVLGASAVLALGLTAGVGMAQQAADPAVLGGMVADSDVAVTRVRDALTSFHGKYDRWPASMDELSGFAAKMGRPIDMAAFANATYSVAEAAEGGQAALFEYVMAGSGAQGAFAVSFNAIQ